MTRVIALLVSLVLLGCGGDEGLPADVEVAGPAISANTALSGEEVRIVFSQAGVAVEGALKAGNRLRIDYDPNRLGDCRGQTNTGGPAWTLTGWYSLDGSEPKSLWIAGHSQEATPPLPIIPLGDGGHLQLWFQVTNRWGCNAWDSNDGQNFRFEVERPASFPGWMGNVGVNISRAGGGCDAAAPLGSGFHFGTWARQRAADTLLCFEVWKQGVTDWNNPDLWKQLDVQVHSRVGHTGPFTSQYVSLYDRKGNNARYAVNLRTLDPFSPYACPAAPVTPSADGQYAELTTELFITVNGQPLRPHHGGVFRGEYADYLSQYAHCPHTP